MSDDDDTLDRALADTSKPVPWQVRLMQSMPYHPMPRFVRGEGLVHFTQDAPDDRVRATYCIKFDAPTDKERLVLLSLRVHSQTATLLPVDVLVRLCNAPRPYLVRRGATIHKTLDDELVTDSVQYTDRGREIAFCSLHAAGFVRADAPRRTRSDVVIVPRTYRYAWLLRDVVLAQQLEALDPVSRACARRDSLTHAPLEGSDEFVFTDTPAYEAAVDYIDGHLAPFTRTKRLTRNVSFSVDTIVAEPWQATLGFTLYAATLD
jgi:hypothetical protein